MRITIVRAAVGVLLLCVGLGSFAAAPNVAFFYGANAPWDELQAFDLVIVEPGHASDTPQRSTPRSELLAYVSVGEISSDRPYAKDVPPEWIPGTNGAWSTVVVDQTQPDWPRFFLDRVIAPLWNAGYRGFFLDNLDSFHLIAKTDEERARQQQGLIGVIRALRAEYPNAKLIFNRGFEILPEVYREAYAVAAESIFRGWDAKAAKYVEVPAADRDWLLGNLERVRNEYKLPVIAIDYVAPGDRALARDTARRIRELGYIPWVANGDLDQLGLGAIEVMPRKILILYERDGSDVDLDTHPIHTRAEGPLKDLGYSVEYVDIKQALPQYPLVGRYAGIVTWFADDPSPRVPALRDWLARQRTQGMRIVMFNTLPLGPTDALAREFGLSGATFTQAAARLYIRSNAAETPDAAALTPWGGYVTAYDVLPAETRSGSIVQRTEFMRRALMLCNAQANARALAGRADGAIIRYELKGNGGNDSTTCAS